MQACGKMSGFAAVTGEGDPAQETHDGLWSAAANSRALRTRS